VREAGLKEAIESFDPPEGGRKPKAEPGRQRLVLEAPLESTAESRQDVPLSFLNRAFAVRGVETRWLEIHHE
jgi:hypothetical protein